jgi:hypothetical protein
VLAVPKGFTVPTAAGPGRADALAGLVPAAGWQQLSCGDGAKGLRFYDWALIGMDHYQVRRYDAWYRHVTLSMLGAGIPDSHRRSKGAPAPVETFLDAEAA